MPSSVLILKDVVHRTLYLYGKKYSRGCRGFVINDD